MNPSKEPATSCLVTEGFLSHPSDGNQSAEQSWGTTDRLESDTSARERETQKGVEGWGWGLEERIEMSPLSVTAGQWSYNTRPHWVRCQLFQIYPQQLPTIQILNGSSLVFSFYTWRPSVCLLSNSLQYMVTWKSFCVLATPGLERSHGHKEEVRVYLSYSSLCQATLLLMVLIRLLYMFTYTLLGIIMFSAHVVKPEVHKQHSLSQYNETV